jgi:ATP-binding cassette subfamily B protein
VNQSVPVRDRFFLSLRECAQMLGNIPRTWRLIYAASPHWTAAWLVLLFVQGLLPVATVYLTRLLVNSLVAAMNARGSRETVQELLFLAALMGGVLLTTELLRNLAEWVRGTQAELIQDHVKALIHAQAVALDLSFYESPDYFDRLYRAANEGGSGPLALLENTGNLLQNGLTLLGMAAVLIPYGAWLPATLVVSTLPALYVAFRFNRRYHDWWSKTTPDRRWAQYYDMMLTGNLACAELRLFGLGALFQSAYQSLRRKLRTDRLCLARDQNLARLAASTIALLVSAAAVLVFLTRVLEGAATLGDFALFYQAFSSGQNLVRALFGNLGQLYSNTLFLGSLFEFLELKTQVVDPPRPEPAPSQLTKGIQFREVTFRYVPGAPPAISNLDLDIAAGQVTAIVGPNGAGKSTLLKLLCRFYDPESGRLEFDGVDIRMFPVGQLRQLISVLFQFPVRYHATAAENIAIAALTSSPSREEIEQAARSSGAHEAIARLPKSYDSLLGKWFADGMELSAGEWQRVALARAYLRRSPIIILDEPTSFMDSWSEADWFDRFKPLAKGRTTIIITHRFTIAMRADIIHVMDAGRIVESGTHAELLKCGGLYARSWTAQMQASPAGTDLNLIPMPLASPIASELPSAESL